MDVDCSSPIISQYAAHHYRPEPSTTLLPVQEDTIHSRSIQASPVHTTTVHNTPLHLNDSQTAKASALYDTSALDLQHSPAETPQSPTFQEILFRGVQINSPISPDPITPPQPKYDSSAGPAPRRACLFPLSPRPSSSEISPAKSPSSIDGFAVHAAGVNAFSATATSHPPKSPTTIPLYKVSFQLLYFLYQICCIFFTKSAN